MGAVAALAVAIPLVAAAAIAATGQLLPPRVHDAAAIAAAATTAALTFVLVARTGGPRVVEWFGGWTPRHDNVAIGIDFAVDRFGAGIAALAAVLVTAALVYSWSFFEEGGHFFPVLVLLFLGGMVGFALTGDLFNWFVFFELMGVAAYALTAYQVDETGPIQGAFNFTVTNSIGGFMVLAGIGLLYGRTGALNLAQIGRQLDERPPDGLVVAAFTLVAVGFLVKAAAVPFHWWLADAHAVAPAPVCVLFSGVMVELGVFAFARLYWTAFEGTLGEHDLRPVVLGLGALTALVGAVLCVLQRHLKRLLAYSTISHVGIFLLGVGLLSGDGLAGAGVYALAHGLAKGSLFLVAGILINRHGTPDELLLRGRAVGSRGAALVYAAGGLALVGPPFLGVFLGKSLLEDGALEEGQSWVVVTAIVASVLTAGAVLRAGARIFLGWGVGADPLLSPEPEEVEPLERESPQRTVLVASAGILVVGSLALGLAPGLAPRAKAGAEQFRDRHAYVDEVLEAKRVEAKPLGGHHTKPESIVLGLVTLGGALAVCAWGLRGHPLPRIAVAPLDRLRALHSGAIGDYVAWMVFGTAALGGLVTLAAR